MGWWWWPIASHCAGDTDTKPACQQRCGTATSPSLRTPCSYCTITVFVRTGQASTPERGWVAPSHWPFFQHRHTLLVSNHAEQFCEAKKELFFISYCCHCSNKASLQLSLSLDCCLLLHSARSFFLLSVVCNCPFWNTPISFGGKEENKKSSFQLYNYCWCFSNGAFRIT